MKKNRIITMSLREVRKSPKRFFSLCVLSALGVAFFVGMKVSGPSMLESLDTYYDNNRMYDLKIMSNVGLDDQDIKEIKNLDDSFEVAGSHTKDAIFNDGKYKVVIRMHEIIDTINDFQLVEGRLPKNYNEIVVEDGIPNKTKFKIGDTIKLELEDNDNSLKTNELKIVGVILSPEYLNNNQVTQSRGNTSLGNGQVAYYSYVPKELFNLDYYTEIFVLDKKANEYITDTKEYKDRIKKDKNLITSIKKNREKERYNRLVEEANNKLKEEKDKAYNELNNAEKQLEQYKIELDNGKVELYNNKIKLDNGKKELDNIKKQLDNANIELESGYKTLNNSKEELNQANNKLNNSKKEIEDKLKEIDNINISYNDLVDFVNKYDSSEFSINDIVKLSGKEDIDVSEAIESSLINIRIVAMMYGINLDQLFEKYGIDEEEIIENPDLKISEILDVVTIDQLKKLILDENFIILLKESLPPTFIYRDEVKSYLEKYLEHKDEIVDLFTGIRSIENGYIEYNKNLNILNDKEKELNEASNKYNDSLIKYNSGIKEYNLGLKKYFNGMNDYTTGIELYNKSIKEYEDNKKNVDEELEIAEHKIDKMKQAVWFIETRNDNNEYITYLSSYKSIEKLSNLFPVIFFLVAIVISLLSMARMAIEDRSEIGTLKALGFSNHEVRLKFVIYALLATIIGGVIGSIIGYLLFPKIIIGIFKIMHRVPVMVYSKNIMPVFIGIFISILCIVGATIFTINNLVKEKTTVLLRPIAPPIGKKIFIEKIPILWDKLEYSNKLTIRNIFRYKRRIFMSIFGIASCTMILLAGYGIKDSIVYVIDKQYNDINHNDALIALDGKLSSKELKEISKGEDLLVDEYAKIDQVEVDNKRLSLIVPDDTEEFKKAITIIDDKTKEEVTLKDNSVVITDKLAKYFNKKVGDTITILESDNTTYDFKIANICDNYIGDYIYMNKKTYKKNIGNYRITAQYIKYKSPEKDNEIITNLKSKNKHILSTVSVIHAKQQAEILFKSLNIIVYVLIIFSGALSFVVFYSLAYINLSEREREIATLKVLGFYNNEVDNYIMKEELIITIIGIIIGLIIGTIYSYMLIDSIEINTMQYIKEIHLDSYIQTFVFMILFTIIVSIGVHFALKKIDLIESLKSVE